MWQERKEVCQEGKEEQKGEEEGKESKESKDGKGILILTYGSLTKVIKLLGWL